MTGSSRSFQAQPDGWTLAASRIDPETSVHRDTSLSDASACIDTHCAMAARFFAAFAPFLSIALPASSLPADVAENLTNRSKVRLEEPTGRVKCESWNLPVDVAPAFAHDDTSIRTEPWT
ncbi:MAG: hypothetical protein WCC66_08115 [Rhizobiaceae bacterium]